MKDAGQKLGEYHKIFDYGKEVMSIRVLLTDKRYLINPHEENEHINLDGKKLGNELSLFTTNAQANLKRYLKSDGVSYHQIQPTARRRKRHLPIVLKIKQNVQLKMKHWNLLKDSMQIMPHFTLNISETKLKTKVKLLS